MGLSPIKPRDDSSAEQARYEADLADQKANPRNWGIEDPPKVLLETGQTNLDQPGIAQLTAINEGLRQRVVALEAQNEKTRDDLRAERAKRMPGRPSKSKVEEPPIAEVSNEG